MAVKPIPEGHHTITPYLAVDDATGAIEFYKRAFGAKERVLMPMPGGKVGHAELEIGDSTIMLSDPIEEARTKTPKTIGATTVGIFIYSEDVDETYKQAIDAGATSTSEPEDMFWGDRFASVTDPYGHNWQIATHVEDLTPEEIDRRTKEAFATTTA